MAITAYGQSIANEALDAGANHAATKPIDFDSLIRGIRQLLASASSLRQRNGAG